MNLKPILHNKPFEDAVLDEKATLSISQVVNTLESVISELPSTPRDPAGIRLNPPEDLRDKLIIIKNALLRRSID